MANASTRQIASVDRYANALFQLAKEAKVLETVSSELLNLKKILNEDDTLFPWLRILQSANLINLIFLIHFLRKLKCLSWQKILLE